MSLLASDLSPPTDLAGFPVFRCAGC